MENIWYVCFFFLSFVICCLTPVVYRLSFIVCRLLSVVCDLSSVVCCLLSSVCRQSSICHVSSLVCRLSSIRTKMHVCDKVINRFVSIFPYKLVPVVSSLHHDFFSPNLSRFLNLKSCHISSKIS